MVNYTSDEPINHSVGKIENGKAEKSGKSKRHPGRKEKNRA